MSHSDNTTADLTATCHTLTLDAGLYCLSLAAPLSQADMEAGLPAIRLAEAPEPAGAEPRLILGGFRPDGWLDHDRPGSLVHALEDGAKLLVTIYHLPDHPSETLPPLKLIRLYQDAAPLPGSAEPISRAPGVSQTPLPMADAKVLVHVSNRGDLMSNLGEWVGIPGSHQPIEGFAIALPPGWDQGNIEYQALIGQEGHTPWVRGPDFCGTRGETIPLLGVNIWLTGAAERMYECFCEASFVDGTKIGPVRAGHPCQSASLAPLEAFRISLVQRGP